MEERQLASPSFIQPTSCNPMKTQFRISRNFSIRDPKTGRHYAFSKGEIAKGKQIEFATANRVKSGFFQVEEILPNDASIIRRRDGRLNWHVANGTDPQMDMEFILLDALVRRFDADDLRGKGSGQTSIFNRCSDAYFSKFQAEITSEICDGSDDPLAHRAETAWRGIRWANSSDVALRCSVFIGEFVLSNY